MSIFLGVSMLLSIENFKGAYIPKSRDMNNIIGIHYKAIPVAPSGSYKASNKPTTIYGTFSWSVESTWNLPAKPCTIIKVVCAKYGAYQCNGQRLTYTLANNSPIGETNSKLPFVDVFDFPLKVETTSAVYFNECGGFPVHDVKSTGFINIY